MLQNDCGRLRRVEGAKPCELNIFAPFFVAFLRTHAAGLGCLTRACQDGNRVGDAGALALAEVLKSNCSLQWLFLVRFIFVLFFSIAAFSCPFSPHIAVSIMTRWTQAKNRVSDAGASALAEALAFNDRLCGLGLVSCAI